MTPEIRAAHFQLTVRCNLKCSFCGQSRGMAGCAANEITAAQWLDYASQLRKLAPAEEKVTITLWGGEPMLYDDFCFLAEELHKAGHPLHIVTNGTEIQKASDVLCRCFDRIFISLDGMRDDHDARRGEGVFDKVRKNLELLRERNGKLIFLCTVSDRNVEKAALLPLQMAELGCDEVVLQQLMYFSSAEIEKYRRFSLENFGTDYPELTGWCRDDDASYRQKLNAMLREFEKTTYPISVKFTPHAYWFGMDSEGCQKQLERIHIRHDGELGFCTDYFGFSAGNVKNAPLIDLLTNERSSIFKSAARDHQLPVCDHCPWRLQ